MPRRFQRLGKEVVRYGVAAQKAAMKARRIILERRKLQAASILAEGLKLPRERFVESIREHGLDETLQYLGTIKKLSLALQKHPEEIRALLQKHKLGEVAAGLLQEFEEARQVGVA